MPDHSRPKEKVGLAIALIAIIIFAGIASYNYWKYKHLKAEKAQRSEIIPVEIAPAQLRSLKQVLELTGDIRPFMEVYVHPKIPGRVIEKIFVERGNSVKKGTLIATLEKDTIKAQIQEARARLASAKARLNEVEANLNLIQKDRHRLENLFRKNAVSRQKLDQVNAKYEALLATKRLALAQIESAKASVRVLQIMLKDHDICSPIAGHVSARYMDAGNMSDTRKPIVRISMENSLKIVTTVTEKDYPLIKKGMEAEIRVDAFPHRVFKGMLSVINPTLDPATRTGEIEIQVDNKDLTLHAGMFAHVRLSVGEREALVIPRDGLNRLPGTGSYYVYLVKHGKALLKNIQIGEIQGNYAEVTDGLKEGDLVIVKGQNRVRDGSLIKVIKEHVGEEK